MRPQRCGQHGALFARLMASESRGGAGTAREVDCMHKFLLKFAVGAAPAALALVLGLAGTPVLARSGESGATADARSLLGSYLAGRVARGQHDTLSAAEYYRSALMRDPDNEVLVEQAMIMDATEGRWEAALLLAEQL